jgi:hypothetical protein
MPRKTIADHAIDVMREDDFYTLMWGDGNLTTIGSRAGTKQTHPLDRMTVVINALHKDKRFEHHYTHGHDARGRSRKVRSVTLKEEFR